MNDKDSLSATTRRRFLKSVGVGGLSAMVGLWASDWASTSARLPGDPWVTTGLPPDIKGRTSWAVILCQFNDLPPLSISPSEFSDFVAGPGKGGVFDYWKDISYGAIDLTGSEVFGWWPMKYSFFKEGANGVPKGRCGDGKARCAWIAEAIRLAKEKGEDLSRFYGVIAVVNANPDDSSDGGRNLALGVKTDWGQSNWRYCRKCKGLAFAGSGAGVCPDPAGGAAHDHSASGDYTLGQGKVGFPGQNNWRYCKKCKGLAFAGSGPGVCPAGPDGRLAARADRTAHDHSESGDYTLGQGTVGFPGQNNWRYCENCKGLAFAGGGSGVCPAGGAHVHASSGDYSLATGYESHFNVSFAAHEMGHAYGLSHAHCAGKPDDYCCPWDIMGPGAAYTSADRYAPFGPGPCAPNLQRLGWLPNDRIKLVTPSIPPFSGGTITLAALNRPDVKGYLMAQIVGPGGVRTVEFRQRRKWDRGLPGDAVLIHEIRAGNEPFFLGDYRAGQRWADLTNGISVVVDSIDTTASTATVTI